MSSLPPPPSPGPEPDQPGSLGPPDMGPLTTQFARLDPGPSQRYGVVGAIVALVGAILLVVSFTAVKWFSFPDTSGHTKFSDVRQVLVSAHKAGFASGPAYAYFGWLAWVLMGVGLVFALVAAAPAVGSIFRVIGPIVGLGAVALTFLAINLFSRGQDSFSGYGDYIGHANVGFYLAIVGFGLIGVGAVLGPRT